MDLNKIFNLFKDEDPSSETLTITNVKDTAFFKLGVFKKMILNHVNFNLNLYNFVKSIDLNDELNNDEISQTGCYIIYNRSWSYISNLDLKDKECFEAIQKLADKDFITVLNLSLKFFENAEEYEKCVVLKEIIDLVNFFSP